MINLLFHLINLVAMATNRGVKVVDKEITDYYKDVDFTKWIGKKVYVGADRKFNNLKITIRNK